MTTPLADLLLERTSGQELQVLLSLLGGKGYPVTDYSPGSAPYTLLEAIAAGSFGHGALLPAVARGGFIALTSGGWLDLLAGAYGLTRAPATLTRQSCTITCAPGLGPQNVNAGFTFRAVGTGNRYKYNGSEPVKVPDGGSVPIELEAEAAGEKYADAPGTLVELVTELPGLSITNIDITTQGADAESDASLAGRCLGRWPGLSKHATSGAVENAIREFSIAQGLGIAKLRIRPSAVVAGQIDVILATVSGNPGSGTVTAIQLFMNSRMSTGETISIRPATNRPVTATGTVAIAARDLSSGKTAADLAWAAHLRAVPIGGDNRAGLPGVLRLAELTQVLMDIGGIDVTNLQLNGAAANLALGSEEVAIVGQPLATSLNWTAV